MRGHIIIVLFLLLLTSGQLLPLQEVMAESQLVAGKLVVSTGSGLHAEEEESKVLAQSDCKDRLALQCDVIKADTLTYTNMECEPYIIKEGKEDLEYLRCSVACSARCE